MFAMETIRSEEEDTGSPIGVGPDDADLQLLHLSSMTSDAAAAAAASIVINPFWAENEERRELLCGQLTVKSPAGDSSGDSQASDGAPGKKSGHRRPLVKQKKHCQSVDDMVAPGASGAASATAPAGEAAGVTIPVTINVSGTQPRSGSANGTVGGAGGSRRPSPRPDSSIEYQLGSESNDADDAASLHHLKPSSLSGVHASSGGSAGRPGGSSPSSILRGQRSTPRQLSVESRVTVAHGPIEDGAPLPAAFEPVPLHLYGKPLLEIDPTVREKVIMSPTTFIFCFSRSFLCVCVTAPCVDPALGTTTKGENARPPPSGQSMAIPFSCCFSFFFFRPPPWNKLTVIQIDPAIRPVPNIITAPTASAAIYCRPPGGY